MAISQTRRRLAAWLARMDRPAVAASTGQRCRTDLEQQIKEVACLLRPVGDEELTFMVDRAALAVGAVADYLLVICADLDRLGVSS